MQIFLDQTTKIAHQSRFKRKWKNLVKKLKPIFRKLLWGHRVHFSPRGRRRVTMNFEGTTLKISKWIFHPRFYQSNDFCIYLQIWNRISRNQDNVICWFWSTFKLEDEESQLVEPKISKWVFSHVFPFAHKTKNISHNWISIGITHFIIFRSLTIY